MNYGYPGGNTHLENHTVSEESFWPSFTDIMMVIVMVFLLVTVAVILNNWTLISSLKSSIKAQEVATSLADARQQKNLNLESQLSMLEEKLLELNEEYKEKQFNLNTTQDKLTGMEQQLTEKVTALAALDNSLLNMNKKLQAEQLNLGNTQKTLSQKEQLLVEKESKLIDLEENLEDTLKQKNALSQLSQTQKSTIDESLNAQQRLRQELAKLEQELLHAKKVNEQNRVKISELETAAKTTQVATQSIQSERSRLEKKILSLQDRFDDSLQVIKKEHNLTLENINQTLEKKREEVSVLESKISKAEQQLEEKGSAIVSLQKLRNSDEIQLKSLQGEFDSLDGKYQKLLRPERSSKGKFVVTVRYEKEGSRKTIRFKSSPSAPYKQVTPAQLDTALAGLREKHKADLYLKIIIPEKSGLSYNEAWKFTINLQKKYDYYYQ